jgi:uncharacterized protein YneF (UPF0154 family)
MSIDWRAPFELAFELGLFLVGAVLVVLVVCIALITLFGVIRAFFFAMKNARKAGRSSESRPRLRRTKSDA